MRLLLVSGLMALLPSCVVAGHAEPWAPVVLRTDPAVWNVDNEVYVYVDDVYRGNLVDGAFRMFLTLEPHRLRVEYPALEPLERTITLTEADYPEGIELDVTPPVDAPR